MIGSTSSGSPPATRNAMPFKSMVEFLIIAAALTAGRVAFALVLLRNRAAPDLVAMPDVAHG
jgi:hypothetical protein